MISSSPNLTLARFSFLAGLPSVPVVVVLELVGVCSVLTPGLSIPSDTLGVLFAVEVVGAEVVTILATSGAGSVRLSPTPPSIPR